MADLERKVILKVGTNDAVRSIGDLKENIKILKGDLNQAEIGTEKYAQTAKKLRDNQDALNNVVRTGRIEFRSADEVIKDSNATYNELSATMSALKKVWKDTADEAKRNEIGKQINSLNDRLKELDASQGVYTRNVGNYKSALDGLSAVFPDAASKVQSLSGKFDTVNGVLTKVGASTGSLTKLLGPLGIAIGAAVEAGKLFNSVLDRQIEGLKRSKEGQEQLERAMRNVTAQEQAQANFWGNEITWVTNLNIAYQELIGTFKRWYEAFLGMIAGKGTFTDNNNAMKADEERIKKVKAELEETTKRRKQIELELTENEGELNRTIQENLTRASQTTGKAADEARKKAAEAENELYKLRKSLAETRLQEARLNGELGDNTHEDNLRIAELVSEIGNLAAEHARTMRKLEKNSNTAAASVTRSTGAVKTAVKSEADKLKEAFAEIDKLLGGFDFEKFSDIDYGHSADATIAGANDAIKALDKNLPKLKEYYTKVKGLSDEQINELIKRYRENVEKAQHNAENELIGKHADKGVEEARFNKEMRDMDIDIDVKNTYEKNRLKLESEMQYLDDVLFLREQELFSIQGDDEKTVEMRKKLNDEIIKLEKSKNLIIKAMEKNDADEEEDKTNTLKKQYQKRLKAFNIFTSGMSELLGKQTAAGKGFAIAQATMDSYQAFTSIISQKSSAWGPGALGVALQIASAAGTLAAGMAQVKNILAVDASGKSTPTLSGAAVTPQFIAADLTPIQYTRDVQVASNIDELNKDTRVYILESDIQDSNRRVNVRQTETSF